MCLCLCVFVGKVKPEGEFHECGISVRVPECGIWHVIAFRARLLLRRWLWGREWELS